MNSHSSRRPIYAACHQATVPAVQSTLPSYEQPQFPLSNLRCLAVNKLQFPSSNVRCLAVNSHSSRRPIYAACHQATVPTVQSTLPVTKPQFPSSNLRCLAVNSHSSRRPIYAACQQATIPIVQTTLPSCQQAAVPIVQCTLPVNKPHSVPLKRLGIAAHWKQPQDLHQANFSNRSGCTLIIKK